MNTGIAALVAGSGKVKMISLKLHDIFLFLLLFCHCIFFCWKSEDFPYAYLITLFLFYDRDYSFIQNMNKIRDVKVVNIIKINADFRDV